MAHDVHRPHDKLFRTVFADQRQAAALLQAHLPESIACHLRWSSLALQDRTFVDDGRRRWRHPTEFAELFAAPVRDWPWVPRFAHVLIDQSQVGPQAVRGRLQGRIAQLMMMARYRHRREALQHAARLLAQMLTGGGGEAVRPLVRYLLATQTRNTARRFGDELREAAPGAGGDPMTTYAEELIREGERKGPCGGSPERPPGGASGHHRGSSARRCGVAGDRGGDRHRPGRLACSQAATRRIGRGDERS